MQNAKYYTLQAVREKISVKSREEPYSFRSHSQIAFSLVTRNRIAFSSSFEEVIEMTDGANLVNRECLDREVTGNNQNDGCMEIICQESIEGQR